MGRNTKIDIAKGIAIILVVIGHGACPKTLNNFIYLFHMPLFFILSGVFYNPTKYNKTSEFIKSRFYSLIIPLLGFAVMNGIIKYSLFDKDFNIYDEIFITPLWFIPILFLTEMYFHLLYKWKGNSNKFICSFCIIVAICGYIMQILNLHSIFKIENSFMALLYYGFGFTFSNKIRSNPKHNVFILLFMTILCLVVSNTIPMTSMFINNNGIFPLSQILAIVCTFIVLDASLFIDKYTSFIKKIFLWAGKRTLIILGIHKILLRIYLDFFRFPDMSFSLKIIKYLSFWIVLYILTELIIKCFPWLTGKWKKKIN